MSTSDIDYEPMSEEEALGLLPKGEYPATIMSSEKKYGKDQSKSYVVFTVSIHGVTKNQDLTVWCFMPFMLKHAAESTGNGDKYMNKSLKLSDFLGKTCNVKVKIKPGNEDYPNPKNVIWDFVAHKPKDDKQSILEFNDEVPF